MYWYSCATAAALVKRSKPMGESSPIAIIKPPSRMAEAMSAGEGGWFIHASERHKLCHHKRDHRHSLTILKLLQCSQMNLLTPGWIRSCFIQLIRVDHFLKKLIIPSAAVSPTGQNVQAQRCIQSRLGASSLLFRKISKCEPDCSLYLSLWREHKSGTSVLGV